MYGVSLDMAKSGLQLGIWSPWYKQQWYKWEQQALVYYSCSLRKPFLTIVNYKPIFEDYSNGCYKYCSINLKILTASKLRTRDV
jgi:hypothetical protein